MRFAKTTTKLCACLGPFCSLGSAVTSPPPCCLRARRRDLGVTALPQPPKSQVLQAAIVPAEDLMRKALHHVDCCQQRSIPLNRDKHTRVACVRVASHVEADLWRCCSLRRGPAQARKVRYGKAQSSMPPLCEVRHLRFTSDITRVMRSRAQRRGSWSGLCESRIDDLARFGIRRHLRRAVGVPSTLAGSVKSGPLAARHH